MDTNDRHDAYFGLLGWDERDEEWQGKTAIPSQGEVAVRLPPEYVNSAEMQSHIHAVLRIIERDELRFRERAAVELFTRGGHVLFLHDDKPFQRDVFVTEMHLGLICFDADFSEISLGYEYSEEIMEHGIFIFLRWNGSYVRVD